MKYMLLTYLDEKAWLAMSPAEQKAAMDECGPHVQQLVSSGRMLDGAPLEPVAQSCTVKRRGGQNVVTDGPFIETREQLGGYTLIEAKDHAEAVAIAAGFFGNGPGDSISTIEVRPVADYTLPEK